MFNAGPADLTAPERPLRVTRAVRRVFDGRSDTALDPELRIFLSDMVRPYGLALREDLLTAGVGHSYGEMAAPLIAEATSADEPVDVLVLAFAMHDLRLGRATSVYLSNLCPGGPMAFAVCDQGSAAAFTALRLIREYSRSGACRRALLLVLEQSVLHYEPAGPAEIPARHAGVALLCDDAGGAALSGARQHADVAVGQVATLLAEDLGALTAGRTDVTLILGGGLAALADAGLAERVRIAPEGQPYTGVWWELAGALDHDDPGLTVFADHDPNLRYLCVSALDTVAARQEQPA
ncbi:2-hydroxy-acid oxidase [Solihabitans fulvus]|uniref:2-hydroxy-acid oxidase n=1 Tax=Solihabitans fulvus TaxID=1892852 RepID=A0A5B2WZB0_9PSEU|nr:2-hydroxy-acid oxidase [Solihabitans fulvus]KAA2255916.1 2-hydroxy-acid oxidase [Solihabitans fulvus]